MEIWNTQTWKKEKIFTTQYIEKYAASLTKTIIALSNKNNVNIIEVPSCRILHSFNVQNNISNLAFSDDGLFLLVADSAEITILNTDGWSIFKSIKINTNGEKINSVDMSYFDRYIVYTIGKILEVIDIQTDKIIKTYLSKENNNIVNAYFLSNPDVIVLANSNKIDQIYVNNDNIVNTIFESNTTIKKLVSIHKIKNQFVCSGLPLITFYLKFTQSGNWTKVTK